MMRMVKKIGSLVMAVIMTLSVAMPYMGTVFASGASDDLTGWEQGTDSILTGNPTDGWDLSVTNNILTGGSKYASYYTSSVSADKIQINMNFNDLSAGSNLWFIVGDAKHSPGSWNDTKAVFIIKKTSDGSALELMAHTGSKEWGKTSISNFDFSKDHVFEFKQVEGVWQPALDGTVYPMDEVDTFVKGMMCQSSDKTVIGFAAQCSGSNKHTITNIKCTDKTIIPDDLTGWEQGTDSTLIGNPTDGWKLSVTNNFITSGSKYASYYTSSVSADKIQINMNLTGLSAGSNLWLLLGDAKHSLGSWNDTKAIFIIKKTSDGSALELMAHTGSKEWGKTSISNFDFSKDHVFEFKQVEGVWQPALDGTVYPMDEVDTFVKGMMCQSSDKTVIGFAAQCSGSNKHTITNIKFVEKTVAPDDLAGWETGETSSITGTPENGWTVSMTGSIFQGSQYGNYYTADLGVSEIQMTFDFSDLIIGKNVWLVVSNAKGAPGEWSDTKVSFVLKKVDDTTLEFVGHTGGAEVGTNTKINNFDFTKVHTLTFEKKAQKWYPAIDATRYEIDCTEFVNGMAEKSPEQAVFGFGPQSDDALIIKNIKFSEKPFDPNNHTGWVLGSTSTVAGDDANGWTLSVKDSLFNASSNISYYITETDASKLQINMDLSELYVNKGLWLFFGDEMHSFGAWNETGIGIILKKMSDGTTLELCAHSGSAQWGTARIPNFEFTTQHTFEFAKVDGVWQVILDGAAYPMDGVDAFVEGMMTNSPDRIVIGFGPQNGADEVHTIKNLTFTEKEYKEIDWICGSASVSGDRNNGYTLHGAAYATNQYVYKLKPQDTTLYFKLNKEEMQSNIIILSEDLSMGLLPEAEAMKNAKGMVLIIEQKNGETYLQYWDAGHKDKVLFLAKYKDFNFDITHSITFKNENGNWYLVLDGTVLRSYQLNHIVENMLTAEDGVYYRFSGWQNPYTFENVKFARTPAASSEESNWTVVGYEMSGKGDKLSFKGDGYASWRKAIDLTKTSLEAQFKPVNGGWVSITIGDTPTVGATVLPGLVVPEGNHNTISFILGRQNETELRVSLYGTNKEGKKAEFLITLMKNFDFDATHEFRFVEKNGNYYLAIDGQILEWPNHDGDNKYITNALTSCLKSIEGESYIRLLNDQVYGAEWGNPTFVEEPFAEADLFVDGDVTVSENKNGLSAVGIGTMGINKKFDILKDKVSVKFKPAEGNWIALTIGDTASPMVNFFVGVGNEHNIMTILLARQKNGVLRISLLDQGQEKMFMALSHFDFEKTHTFSFVEHRGKYYLAIDDRMIEAVVADGDDEVVTTWVTKCVKALSKSGAYIRFVSPYDTMEISNVSWKGMGTIRGIKEGTITGKSPKTGDFTPVQPIVCAMVLSGSAIAAVGVQKYARRKKEK